MTSIRFDHVGVVVHDLETTAQFFVDLGFDREGPVEVSGSWMDRVIGLNGARVDLIVVTAPDGSGKLELTAFHEPTRVEEPAELPVHAAGYRHVAYRVTNVDALVARARTAGYDTVGDVVDYHDSYRLAYIRGPEGLIVELAQALPAASAGA